ncbi:hypothetical protein CWB99_11265 [Pseudoalteromonas rubra]|uniref:MAPEG family protein n=1 Tax=Pseudoalteromonas rubra TaxID=43658 RepID=A0A5S3WL76_9GAMM|nr:MAPEG family protein [Pseudoalteromonas rubra]TMP28485.1 hypothetical protein CWB99_11265 [Pseudoalteromonas rubra]TMP30454.1 hypothetical protein CWC00_16390 [Pseudoalteromonas rubra]
MDVLLTPMLMHILLCAVLYVLLTVARAPAVWGLGSRQDGSNPFEDIQPRISANLSNQFEWPIFFYVVCLVLIFTGEAINPIQVYLAWGFILGRCVHSCVQVFTSNVRMRGIVFTINFVAVLAMWGVLCIDRGII